MTCVASYTSTNEIENEWLHDSNKKWIGGHISRKISRIYFEWCFVQNV